MLKKQKKKRSLEERLATYFVDSTAIQLVTIPVKTCLDIIIGYPISTSVTEKLWSLGGTYLIGGPVSSEARDAGSKKLHFDTNTPEWKKILYDAALFGTLHTIITVGMYGAASLKEKTGFDLSTVLQTAGFHFLTYIPASIGISYSIDFFRAVTGIGNAQRFEKLQTYSSTKRKTIGFGILAGLVGITTGIYCTYPKQATTAKENPPLFIETNQSIPHINNKTIEEKTIYWDDAQKLYEEYKNKK